MVTDPQTCLTLTTQFLAERERGMIHVLLIKKVCLCVLKLNVFFLGGRVPKYLGENKDLSNKKQESSLNAQVYVCVWVCVCVCAVNTKPLIQMLGCQLQLGMGVRGRTSLTCHWPVRVRDGLGGLVSYLQGCHGVHLEFVRKRSTEGQEAGVDVELPITGKGEPRNQSLDEHTNKHVFIIFIFIIYIYILLTQTCI